MRFMAAVMARGTRSCGMPLQSRMSRSYATSQPAWGQIENIGSNTLHIHGVPRLHGGEFTIGPDYLEVVSFIGAAVVTHSSIRIREAGPQYLDMTAQVFNRWAWSGRWRKGVISSYLPTSHSRSSRTLVTLSQKSKPTFAGFPHRFEQPGYHRRNAGDWHHLVPRLDVSQPDVFHRQAGFYGAHIVLCDPHRCIVQGPTQLFGEIVESRIFAPPWR